MHLLSPELKLLLTLTGDIYREPKITASQSVNWSSFFELARVNKMLYPALARLRETGNSNVPPEILEKATVIMKSEEAKMAKLGRTLEVINNTLRRGTGLLFKTYLGYVYAPEDVDIVVTDLEAAQKLFWEGGYEPIEWWDGRSFRILESSLLDIEVYDKVSPGPLFLMDKEWAWIGGRDSVMARVSVCLPSVETDIMTYIADANFRTYEFTLGELLYIYRLAPKADWEKMSWQAKKYRWLKPFRNTVAIMNGLHRQLYGDASPMENYYPGTARINLQFPFIMSLNHITGALAGKGAKYLVKLPGYLSVRLKKHPALNRLYSRAILVSLSNFVAKRVYSSLERN